MIKGYVKATPHNSRIPTKNEKIEYFIKVFLFFVKYLKNFFSLCISRYYIKILLKKSCIYLGR